MIPTSAATPVARPSFDKRGLRFEMDGRLLRAFRADFAPFYRSLMESPGLEKLFEAGLVRTWISDVEIPGFDLVLESERLPVVSYPLEWPTAMLHEAALVTARLARALADLGLGLQDGHPWNVLFDDTRGKWVDLGSICPMQSISSGWIREFRRHVVVPLALHSIGWHSMADSVTSTLQVTGAKAMWDTRLVSAVYPVGLARISHASRNPARFLDRLIAYLERLQPRASRTRWSNYSQRQGAAVGDQSAYSEKQRSVEAFLDEVPPGLLLDVGANAGWYSELGANHGHRVIALDTDDQTMSELFVRARHENLAILPLRMDIMWPTGSHGMNLACEAAPDRLRADTAMFLAILHHLAKQGIPFETFAATVDKFARSAAIVEFIPREDVYVSQWPIAGDPRYDMDHLIEAMTPHFGRVDIRPSSPSPRQMLLFRR